MLLFRVLRVKVVQEAHSCANKDGEAGNCDCIFRLKLPESEEHGVSDATTADTSNCAEGHDEAEDE